MADVLSYEQVTAALRVLGDYSMPEGVLTFNEYRVGCAEERAPRWVLIEHMLKTCPGACDWHALIDLWLLGIEQGIGHECERRRPKYNLLEYEVEFISASADRCGLQHFADRHPEHADVLRKLGEYENSAKPIWQADWHQQPIIGMHGLHSVDCTVLCEWPDGRRLYVAGAYEGEGWWGTLWFSVRVTNLKADEAVAESVRKFANGEPTRAFVGEPTGN